MVVTLPVFPYLVFVNAAMGNAFSLLTAMEEMYGG